MIRAVFLTVMAVALCGRISKGEIQGQGNLKQSLTDLLQQTKEIVHAYRQRERQEETSHENNMPHEMRSGLQDALQAAEDELAHKLPAKLDDEKMMKYYANLGLKHFRKMAQAEGKEPEEADPKIKKFEKHTDETFEKKDKETVVDRGMKKNILNINGEIAKKDVVEKEDKKSNGEEIIQKEENLEVDRSPSEPQPTIANSTGSFFNVFSVLCLNFFNIVAFSLLLSF